MTFFVEMNAMANLIRFDPFEDRFEDVLRGMLRPFVTSAPVQSESAVAVRMDVSENENAYVVKAEIPGVKREDIHVSIDGNQVSISAETKREQEVKEGARVLRSERYYGKVYRGFALAQDVDEAGASAKYADGVLELVLPKKLAAAAKKLTIQ
jgi:HSP20 family protein